MADNELTLTRDELSLLPRSIGVYLFRGKRTPESKESVLYVGKAKNLQSRVRQYFVEGGDGRPFNRFLQERVQTIQTIVVATEQDALILENELIKKHKPAYNIHLKDDKRYLSLRLDTSHEWPKIEVVRKIKKDKATYLGPFSSATRLRSTLDFMQKVFPLRTCDDRKLYSRTRPCIEYEIKRCVAPCVNYIDRDDYKQIVQSTLLFLKGQNEDLVKGLKDQMAAAVEEERYEDAASFRDRIAAIESIVGGQSVIGLQQFRQGVDQDVVGVAMDRGRAAVTLLFVRSGIIIDKRSFEFSDLVLNQEELVEEFVGRYYSDEVFRPDEILTPFAVEGDFGLRLLVPRSDEKQAFVRIAMENARASLESSLQKSERLEKTLTQLQRLLHLQFFPKVMDCVDISHHQGAETVASVVRFVDGLPFKGGYRKIKLTEDQVDDFESMREALARRYKEESDLPNLLVIDGGRGQLSSAEKIIQEKGWLEKIDLVSLAKARDQEALDPFNPQNRERVFKPHRKNPLLLKEDSAEELLLRFLRDEAHRFAITYHRLRKEGGLSVSLLDSVPGISEKTKIKLLSEFGSIEGILEATDEELLKVLSKRTLASLRLTLDKPL